MKTIIFGNGFTGKKLTQLIKNNIVTELPHLCQNEQIPFDFHDEKTWQNLPPFDRAIITFKMAAPSQAKKFSEFLKGKKTIILSSAKNLQNSIPDEVIDETTNLSDNDRAKSEIHFAENSLILLLGLIWGEERNPLRWLNEGRIKNGNKWVNFIHVDDLTKIINFFLENELNIGNLLISDGNPQQWQTIANFYGKNLPTIPTSLESRRFNTLKLSAILPINFKFNYPIPTNSK